MPSRSLSSLNLPTKLRAERFVDACKAEGIDVLIYCTFRSHDEQDSLFRIGRTIPGDKVSIIRPMGLKVTNARGGESWHNYGSAFDFVPLVHGKAAWNDSALYAQCGAIAESVGLEWAGRWTGSLRETCHCQYRAGYSLAEMQHGALIV